MTRKPIYPRQRFIALLITLAIGLSSYACSDSASISEDVAVPLSSLTVTPGTLQPGFFANNTNYTVNAPTSATSVTVTAAPRDSTTTMTINTIPTLAGQARSVNLGQPGSTTTITILLEAQNGTDTTYIVTVRRLLSSDNNLSVLDVTPGNLDPAFDRDTENYTVNVGVLVDSVTVSATKSDPTGTMLIGPTTVPPGTASGQATIPLGGPGTTTRVTITVTAPNNTAKAYTVNVVRALSSDNNLSALTVTPGSLNPAFASGQLTYTVDVTTEVTSVDVTATKSDPNAVISGSLPNNGQATIQLNGPGTSTPVSITVTAPNGSFQTYNISVNRAAPAAPPAPTVAPDLISEDDSCIRDIFNNCIPPTDEDNITSVTTPRFRISPPAVGETPSLYIDGIKVLANLDPVANTLAPTTALNIGSHPISYTVANAGGESAQSPALSVIILP